MTKTARGRFIVIEGSGGSGKTTQMELLIKRLKKQKVNFVNIRFPRYKSPAGYFVNSYFKEKYGPVYTIDPYQASIFFAMDRFDAKKEIHKLLDDGVHVICDRFIGSNMGYQGAKFEKARDRKKYFKWLHDFEFNMLGIPKPDLNIFLHMPAKIAYRLMQNRDAELGGGPDAHERDMARLEKSVATYLEIVKLFPADFSKIDCAPKGKLLSIEDVHALILEKLSPL
jgi:dTMP kinase